MPLRPRCAAANSRGDSYDNALAESVNGLYKTEVIYWQTRHSLEQVELATAEWVTWWNELHLHCAIDDLPPAGYEARYFQRHQANQAA